VSSRFAMSIAKVGAGARSHESTRFLTGFVAYDGIDQFDMAILISLATDLL